MANMMEIDNDQQEPEANSTDSDHLTHMSNPIQSHPLLNTYHRDPLLMSILNDEALTTDHRKSSKRTIAHAILPNPGSSKSSRNETDNTTSFDAAAFGVNFSSGPGSSSSSSSSSFPIFTEPSATTKTTNPTSTRKPLIHAAPPCGVSLSALTQAIQDAIRASHEFTDPDEMVRDLVKRLPTQHFETGYVLDLAARLYFERADYRKAEQLWNFVYRKVDVRRIEGLEYYSTCLWHLKRDVEVGHLGHQCMYHWGAKQHPGMWCVIGNAFSLQKDHETAIKFFRRALQIDPYFAYAYTLCGHEYT